MFIFGGGLAKYSIILSHSEIGYFDPLNPYSDIFKKVSIQPRLRIRIMNPAMAFVRSQSIGVSNLLRSSVNLLGSKIDALLCLDFSHSEASATSRTHFRVMATSTKLAFLARDSGNSSSSFSPSRISFPSGVTESTISSITPTVPVLSRTRQSSWP